MTQCIGIATLVFMLTDIPKIPNHVGFIMDGNRRWAKEHKLQTLEGHRRGYANMKRVLQWCIDRGIHMVTVYAFSTENWNRSKQEVSYLMRLFSLALKKELHEFHNNNVRLQVLGRIEGLPIFLQKEIHEAMEKTKSNTKAVLNMAINYGGRTEIVDAVKKLIIKKLRADQVTEETLKSFMYADGVADPDLIVRTSGVQRISNFLLWGAAYAELYFTPKKWPEFSEADLDIALEDYAQRKRNFGA